MIDCPNGEIRDRLPDFLHDQLDPETRAEVSAHVAACGACTAELTLLSQLRVNLRAAPRVDVARIVAALPRSSGSADIPVPVAARTSAHFNWRIVAAVLALAVSGGSAAIWNLTSRGDGAADAPPAESPGRSGGVQRIAAVDVTIDADLADASTGELESLLQELESFDGLPAGEPESLLPSAGDERIAR